MPRLRSLALLAAAGLALAAPAAAQTADGASTLLPPDHWAVRAAWRIEALGLAPAFLPAQGAVPRGAVEAALRAGREADDPGVAAMAEAWHRRFVDEFAEYGEVLPRAASFAAGAHVRAAEGRLAPPLRPFIPAEPRADEADGGVTAEGAARLGPALAAMAEVRAETEDVRAHRWEAVAAWGPLALSAGRQPVGYGPARGGGIVFTATEPLARLEVRTERPLRVPVLGQVTVHAFLSPRDEPRHPGDPWLFGARLGVRPHPRFTVGVNRGALFGGDSVEATTVSTVAGMLIGRIRSVYENQVVAVDGRWRLPTDRVLPLTAYLEWGADDGAGAWFDVPGITGGLSVPALPGAPHLSVGAEATHFGATCCGNGPWYYNTTQVGNWAVRDRLLGHPLGGEGWEARAYGGGLFADARLRVDAEAFVRRRGASVDEPRGNLFIVERRDGFGGALDVGLRVTRTAEARLRAWREQGDGGWKEQGVAADVRVFF